MEDKVNVGLVIISVLIPLVGYILYFAKREDSPNAASNYLWSAVAGSIIGLIMVFA